MKTIVLRRIHNIPSQLCCLLALILLISPLSPVSAYTGAANHINDTIFISKAQTSKKYKIKIYPSATSEVVFFTASGMSGKVYQLFLFDLDGNLVKQTQIRNKETTLLANFLKGNYTFEVFSDDERIENGTLVVR